MVRYTPADTSTPGVKEVVATCGSSSATCTVTVVGVELISCRDVVSATDNPGATETVYVAVGEDGKTETITAVPKPAGQWPAGWPMWDGADQCAGDAGSAVFPLIESLDAEGTVVRVTCGDSAAALRIVVFEVGVYNENTGAIKDGDVSLPFTCEVFPEGLDVSSYTWSATWPELAYNNPHVKFTDGSSSETRISPAWWYSTSGETCSDDIAVYDIYCTVVVGGTVASNRTPEKLCVDVGGEKKNDGSERVGGGVLFCRLFRNSAL